MPTDRSTFPALPQPTEAALRQEMKILRKEMRSDGPSLLDHHPGGRWSMVYAIGKRIDALKTSRG